ncbi:MAG: hypothetical protein HKN91_02060 [Acidimicrobiia bacterium]|nr:hypothetical protein [Acidimicrobiia bacterium]
MDDLIKQLQEKTGLGVDQIKSVVSGVADFLGDKLPGPLGSQVSKLLGGGDDDGDAAAAGDDDDGGGLMDKAKDALGGLLGGGD